MVQPTPTNTFGREILLNFEIKQDFISLSLLCGKDGLWTANSNVPGGKCKRTSFSPYLKRA